MELLLKQKFVYIYFTLKRNLTGTTLVHTGMYFPRLRQVGHTRMRTHQHIGRM